MTPSAERPISYPALDSLRFVGAFGVLVTHVAFQTGQYDDTVTGTFLARLDSGVALFFVLSGFLLSRPFLSRLAEGREAPATGYYLWKRGLRVLPVYVITVVLALSLVPESQGPFWPVWVENLTLTTIYTSGTLPSGLTQMWSLATEVSFYLLLPILMLVVTRLVARRTWAPARIWAFVAVLAAGNVAWLCSVPLDTDRALWLPAFLTWFGAGIALAVVSVDLGRPSPHRWSLALNQLGRAPGSCLVLAASLLLVASTPVAGPIVADVPTWAEAVTKNLLYTGFATFLVLPGVFAPSGSLFVRAFSWPPLRYLGRISYGVFCTHLLVLYVAFELTGRTYFTGGFLLFLAMTTVGSLVVSAALYRWVERPSGRLRRLGRPSSEKATAPSAPSITI